MDLLCTFEGFGVVSEPDKIIVNQQQWIKP